MKTDFQRFKEIVERYNFISKKAPAECYAYIFIDTSDGEIFMSEFCDRTHNSYSSPKSNSIHDVVLDYKIECKEGNFDHDWWYHPNDFTVDELAHFVETFYNVEFEE